MRKTIVTPQYANTANPAWSSNTAKVIKKCLFDMDTKYPNILKYFQNYSPVPQDGFDIPKYGGKSPIVAALLCCRQQPTEPPPLLHTKLCKHVDSLDTTSLFLFVKEIQSSGVLSGHGYGRSHMDIVYKHSVWMSHNCTAPFKIIQSTSTPGSHAIWISHSLATVEITPSWLIMIEDS